MQVPEHVPEEGKGMETPDHALNQLYFYLTRGCNLRCRHCWISPEYQGEKVIFPALDLPLFRSIVEQAKPLGLSAVKLTGGEPLLHPQISGILNYLSGEDVRLNVETNGVLCTPDRIGEIARCKEPFVSVSIDGADAGTHEWVRGVKGCFEPALNAVRNLAAAGLRPQVIMTLMRRNLNQVEGVVRLAESLGASSVKFNIVQPTARGERMHEAGETPSIRELVELGRCVENELSPSTGLPLYYSHPAAFKPLSKIFGKDGDGCAVCGILGILGVLADGSYALCGIGETVPELVLGHAARDRLEQVWNHSPVLREIREGIPQRFQGICNRCVMVSRCLGSCVAQNYYSTKSFWSPYWYCDQALKQGLFPETRIRCPSPCR
jgi:SynChlorMet cassette radical SAM/SPASM protein ScmF